MFTRLVTAGTVAGATLLSPLAGVTTPATADDNAEPVEDLFCTVNAVTRNGISVVDERTEQCYPTLDQMRSSYSRASGIFTIASHFQGGSGGPMEIDVRASTCAAQWTPSDTWKGSMSSTRVSSACSGAKHYTGTNCGGSYQLVDLVSPITVNLLSPLNNNVGCVKYA
jgi:hypothetical protein